MRLQHIALLWMAFFLCVTAPFVCGQVEAWLPDEALSLLVAVQTNNPQLVAAQARNVAESARAEAYDGFYQPQVGLTAGVAKGPAAAPESTLFPSIGGDAASLQAGVLLPLRVGAYVGAGISQRYLFEVDGFEDLGQSAAGVRVEVPLLRDRGFRSQRLQQSSMDATAEAAAERARAIGEAVAREALWRYATWLYTGADVHESLQSVKRVTQLLDETVGRVELETLAEYQVFTAEMEVAFRQEELRQAEAALTNACYSLAALAGGLLPAELSADPAILRQWAALCATSQVARLTKAAVPRAEWREAMQVMRAAEQAGQAQREKMHSKLSLVAGVGVQGEDENGGLGSDNLLSDDRAGIEVALVWSRPFHFDAEAATLRAYQAEVRAARADLNQIQLEINSILAQSYASLQAARDRMGLVDRAVEGARRALDAEMERLRMGEGRSRNVLDAQKDLTNAERRVNRAALDMIFAFTDVLHAAGVPLTIPEVNDVAIRTSP